MHRRANREGGVEKMKAEAHKELDFESLPPALQRKFFSNVERLRLARGDRWDGFHSQCRLARVPRRLPFCTIQGRSYPKSAVKSLNKNRKCHSHKSSFLSTTNKLRKTDSLHLAVQVDSRCFHSLPHKIQQKLFSKEEQNWFHQTQSETRFFDAAGEAPCPLEKANHYQYRLPEVQSSGGNSIAISQSSTLYFDFSDSDSDSDSSSDTNMDNPLYDDFRWFEEDGDLDLRLDEYHTHVAKSISNLPPRERPSFRTAVSFNPGVSSHKSTSAVSRQKIQPLRRSSTFPTAPIDIAARDSSSQPSSTHNQAHLPQFPPPSIATSAQYYQDPEARLKLRVYLASPQNFDEAIEFGFPAVHNERAIPAERIPTKLERNPQMFTGTFLDEDTSGSNEKREGRMNVSRLSYVVYNSRSSEFGCPNLRHRSWLLPPSPSNQQHPDRNREMTLKMTLTRPDLRATVPPSRVDPPLEDNGSHLWGSGEDEQGLVRKMWRKFRKQKC
ncbi:hypothetical protein BDV26DRAFT_263457 [Aspergillus bertholletiae]|uniref:Uncharacterized protein n=1 Tax=Aspergillus bertholletiae TaxID=1226010 RepID=A0A5N7B7B9_9EURO|nr:hypothetical protein BDV26DRAFT_263457 [Aspergillus bertholletiae]